MQIDTVLYADPANAAEQARALADQGFDGVFTFEGIGDVFLPLAFAAAATDLTIYPNLAIAFPRSPMHTAYTAWDLQKLSSGRFLLGLGTQIKANIERRFSSEWSRPVDRMTEYVQALKAIFRCWQDGERLDFRGRVLHVHADAADVQPRPKPVRAATDPGRRPGPEADPGRRGQRRRPAAAPVHVRAVPARAVPGQRRRWAWPTPGAPATTSRSSPPASSAPDVTTPRWRQPSPAPATCSPSTARPRPTDRCSTRTAGATCSPS